MKYHSQTFYVLNSNLYSNLHLNGRDLKRKNFVRISFNSPAKASLYELLCYYSREHFDPKTDDFHTFIYFTQSSPYSSPAVSTVLLEAEDGNVNVF